MVAITGTVLLPDRGGLPFTSKIFLFIYFFWIIFVTAFVNVWKSGQNLGGYDYCSCGYTFLSRNKCKGVTQWWPFQDGGRADTSAPIGSISLWGVYIYYVYVVKKSWQPFWRHSFWKWAVCFSLWIERFYIFTVFVYHLDLLYFLKKTHL